MKLRRTEFPPDSPKVIIVWIVQYKHHITQTILEFLDLKFIIALKFWVAIPLSQQTVSQEQTASSQSASQEFTNRITQLTLLNKIQC